MADKLVVTGARGPGLTEIARRTGNYGVQPTDSDAEALGKFADAAIQQNPGFKGDTGDTGPANSTYTTLAGLKAAAVSNASYIFAPPSGSDGGAAAGTFLYQTAGAPYTADGENVIALDAVPLTTGALVRQDGDSLTYKYKPAAASKVRTPADKLDDTISVFDFMTPAQIAAVRNRTEAVEVTDAVNAAFQFATLAGKAVYFPNGAYICGNLIFGAQNQTGQSSAPLGIIGQSKLGTNIKAKPGLTGTLLKSQSVAGVTFRDFSLETFGSNAQAWDCSWKPGPGPSTQCVIRDMIITVHNAFSNGGSHIDWGDLNDTYPTGVTVRPGGPTDYSNCYISMVQSGGLAALNGCIWTGGWMNFGCQNGELNHCWGHGIQFAVGCLNHVKMQAGYMYANPLRSAIFWSESEAQNSGMKAFVLIATELNTEMGGIASYFDINLFSMLHLIGCEFIGDAPALFGAVARGDGIGPALCKIQGGTYYPQMVANDVTNGTGIQVEAEGFRNAGTSRMLTKNREGTFTPVIAGQGHPGTYTPGGDTFGRWQRVGNMLHFRIRLDWSAYSDPAGAAQVSGLPFGKRANAVCGVTIEGGTGDFETATASIGWDGNIVFYKNYPNTVTMPAAGGLMLSGFISVEA